MPQNNKPKPVAITHNVMMLPSETVSMISMRKQNAVGAQRSEQNVQLVLEADPMLAGMSKRQRKRHTRKDIAEHRVLRD